MIIDCILVSAENSDLIGIPPTSNNVVISLPKGNLVEASDYFKKKIKEVGFIRPLLLYYHPSFLLSI